jgi:hypothetical protein
MWLSLKISPMPAGKIKQKLLIWNLGDNLLPIMDDKWRHIPQQCKTTYFPDKKYCEYNETF